MLRRHLDTTRAEVRAKPWWEHDLIMEGLSEEFSDDAEGASAGSPAPDEDPAWWNPYAEGQEPSGGVESLPDITQVALGGEGPTLRQVD